MDTYSIASIDEKQQEIVETFGFLNNWEERYEHMIDLGKSLPLIDSEYKTNDFIIKGCQSQVWMHAELKENRLFFTADSDAIITKGIIAILVEVFSGQSPMDIINSDIKFVDQIGIKEHLSPTRANGLMSMIKQIKFYAIAFQTKIKK